MSVRVSVHGYKLTCRCLIQDEQGEPSLCVSPGKEMLERTGLSVLRAMLDGQDVLSAIILSHRLSSSGRKSIARKRRNPDSR